MSKPRAYTPEELRDKVRQCWMDIAKYFATEPIQIYPGKTEAECRCEAVVITICSMLDGSYGMFPHFDIVARTHRSDKKFCVDRGQNWIKSGTVINKDCCLDEKLPL